MIGRLQGVLISKQAPELLVDVNGVGYEVQEIGRASCRERV